MLFHTCQVIKDGAFHGLIKQLLINPSWKYDDDEREELQRDSISATVEGIKEKFYIPDILLYVHEGFFPFLHAFYGEAYRNQHNSTLKNSMEKDFTFTTYKALLVSSNL